MTFDIHAFLCYTSRRLPKSFGIVDKLVDEVDQLNQPHQPYQPIHDLSRFSGKLDGASYNK
jgi:hypothetical protein